MKNKFQTISIVTLVLIILRCMVESNPQCVLVVSCINLVALLVVVYLIVEQIGAGMVESIKEVHVPRQIEEREIREVKIKLGLIIYVPFALAALVYVIFLSCGLGNDIVSIIALGLSLCDNHIVSIAVSLYRKKE